MELYEIAKRRKATKIYNPNKIIDKKTLIEIFEIINTAPTSMGLEHWRVLSLRDKEIKKDLSKYLKYNDKRFIDCSDALIFIVKGKEYFKSNNKDLIRKVNRSSDAVEKEFNKTVSKEEREKTLSFIEKTDHGNNDSNYTEWSKRQAYIAASYALLAAESKKINSTPVEGFEKELKDGLKKLNLIDEHEEISIIVLLGYVDGIEKPTIGKVQLRDSIEENFIIK